MKHAALYSRRESRFPTGFCTPCPAEYAVVENGKQAGSVPPRRRGALEALFLGSDHIIIFVRAQPASRQIKVKDLPGWVGMDSAPPRRIITQDTLSHSDNPVEVAACVTNAPCNQDIA